VDGINGACNMNKILLNRKGIQFLKGRGYLVALERMCRQNQEKNGL
jgi:hypothetical protein